MPLIPRLTSFPAIRKALVFYQICSVITGTFLLLLVTEMVVKYGFHTELFMFDKGQLFAFSPLDGLGQSTGEGLNVNMTILIVHGWFYVVYLFACFQVWSLMRWDFWRFIGLASGGVVPFASFVMEGYVAHAVRRYLRRREEEEAAATASASTPPTGAPPTTTTTAPEGAR